jgi:hypothetical protein
VSALSSGGYNCGEFSRSVKRSRLRMKAACQTATSANSSCDRYGLGAASIYLGFAVLIFGHDLLAGLSAVHLGRGPDPTFFMWLLKWWPHALALHANPFISPNVWAPDGLNLAWETAIPLASLAMAPVTNLLGPVVSYNLLCMLCPALAGWTAFVLARHIGTRWHAALVAGYLFGFSSYMLSEMTGGHPALMLIFPVPLFAMIALKAYAQEIKPAAFAALAALLIVVEFLLSAEIAATMEVFGGIALLLAWYLTDNSRRKRVESLIVPLMLANAGAVVFLAPYLYCMFAYGVPRAAINSPAAFSTDLLNFIVPTRTVQIGAIAPLEAIAASFPGNIGEAGGYIALPLLLIAALYGRAHWQETATRWLFLMLAIIAVAELGPRLHAGGITMIGMPWKLATHLPLLGNALPARFSMYASLIIAMVVALWLSRDAISLPIRWTLIVLVMVFSLPNLAPQAFTAAVDLPPFFASPLYRSYLKPNETVLVLPFGITGSSMLWLAQTDMYFRMAGGRSANIPHDYQAWPIVNSFTTKTLLPDPERQLEAFCAAHRVTTILAEAAQNDLWAPMLAAIDKSPRTAGGMIIYRVGDLSAYNGITAEEMERRADDARFAALAEAARVYLAKGGNPALLSAMELQNRGLLPPHWVNDPDVRTRNGLFLGPLGDGLIGIGVDGSYDALRPLIERYRRAAEKIYFPYPRELAGEPRGNTFMRLLVIAFKPQALANPRFPAR